ncbi:MAG: recombinase family protein [Rhodocyclaceae bacterium]|nr:recombinase family protein [Rhodocyclaceae bacterium]
MPTAYSYVRFSSARQAGGDSLRRQTEMARAYASRHELELADVSYQDLGVSGFDKSNFEKGALSVFLKLVSEGKISQGSYLLVEQFDRLSRAEIPDALRLLLNLVSSGIIVVTLLDQRVWDKNSINDVANILTSIISMHRAHEESALKSKRLRSVWGKKKENASRAIVTSECPRWLKLSDDGSHFEVREDRANSVHRVFDMRTKGFGVVAIVRRANQEKWPVPGNGSTWHTSLVGRILRNRAVLGEYQPLSYQDKTRVPVGEPVKGYYPAIIDESTFLKAQAIAIRHTEFPRRRDTNYRNFLQGLLYCKCGKRFVRKNKTSTKKLGYSRYYCNDRVRGITKCPSASSSNLEGAVLTAIANLLPQHFADTQDAQLLQTEIELLETEICAHRQRIDKFAEAIAEAPSHVPTLALKIIESETAILDLSKRRDAKIAELEESRVENPEEILTNLMRAVTATDSVDARVEFRETLMRFVDRIVVFPTEQYIALQFKGMTEQIIQPMSLSATLPGIMSSRD